MQLAERLGGLASQMASGNMEEISIQYEGAIAEMKTALLRSSAVKGVLQGVSADAVNIVNAVSNAQERGIRLEDSSVGHSNGADGLRVTLISSSGRVTVRGTVMHGASPHIAELDGIEVES